MRGLRLPIVIVTLVICLFTNLEKSQAYISLLDGNLEVNGFFKVTDVHSDGNSEP